MFIENYILYLTERGYSKQTIKIYSRKLKCFLDNGFSFNDLIGSVDRLITDYSKGGVSYSTDKHGNTRNALKRLNDYLLRDYLNTLYIKCETINVAFQSKSTHITGYLINNRIVTIIYNTGKTKKRKIDDNDYYALLKFLDANKHHLSNSDLFSNPTPPIDAYHENFEYSFGTYSAYGCNDLFKSSTPEQIRKEYKSLIDKICS